jgi:polyphosphate glucokinase
MDVLVIDVGGSHVKLRHSAADETLRFDSGPDLTPQALVEEVVRRTRPWRYDVISVGIPGAVSQSAATAEPGNLGKGWLGFDFEQAFGKPVRLANDAVMQALGGYDGGRMLFLGLGTGLGSALVSEFVVVPLELGTLPYAGGQSMADRLGRSGLETCGKDSWLKDVRDIASVLRRALAADYVVLGGGNAELVGGLPEGVRCGDNDDAFVGGFRLWEEVVEPHDRLPPPVWRVIR